jgi:hypothetical protein
MSDIKTPETHPNHETVGRTFKSFGELYYCDSYDPQCGFWMTKIGRETERRNVSERAIGRTFHLDQRLSYDDQGQPLPRPSTEGLKP